MVDSVDVLAIDTASPAPAVALLSGGEIVEARLSPDRKASEELLPALRSCLERAGGIPLERLFRLAVCAGPGSFTGMRVGLATVWGLSRAAGVPLEAVSTLEAMAEAWRGEGTVSVWTALDAGRGEAVFQRFALTEDRARAESEPSRAPIEAALRAMRGTAAVALPRDLLSPDGPALPRSPARALALAVARAPRLLREALPAPIYARSSAAEEKHGAA